MAMDLLMVVLSFEAPVVNGYSYRPAGATWVFIGNSGIQANDSKWGAINAPDGTQTAFLQDGTNPGGNGSFSQRVNINVPGTYIISFQTALRCFNTSGTRMSFNVAVDGYVIGSYSPKSVGWVPITTNSFTLTTGTHTIAFIGTGTRADTTDFIDSVTLNFLHS